MNSKRLLFLLCIIVLHTACKRELAISEGDAVKIEDFRINELQFDNLSLRSKLQYTDNSSSLKATANIRIQKDSLIWFSVTPGLGIEAARGIITKDSLVIVDRINKQYSIFKFEDLSKKFKFPLTYDLLQSVILGNAFKHISNEDNVTRQGSAFKLNQKEGSVMIGSTIDNTSLKIEKVLLEDNLTNNEMLINYSDFQMVESEIMPANAFVSIKYKATQAAQEVSTQINLEHNKTEINGKNLKFPFNIPSKYDRK